MPICLVQQLRYAPVCRGTLFSHLPCIWHQVFPDDQFINIFNEGGIMKTNCENDPLEGGDSGESVEDSCFICWRSHQGSPLEPLFKGSYHHRLSKSVVLKSQLSVIFLLRKVLGVHPDVLVKVLETYRREDGGGNPSEWGVQLCGSCHLMFREAEFVFRRLVKFQADFEHLARELRELLVASSGVERINSCKVNGGVIKRRRPGRPSSKKKQDNFGVRAEENHQFNGRNVAEYLRNKFVESYKSEEGQPEVCSPGVLFTTRGTDSILDDIQTTQPIRVQVIQKHFQVSHGKESGEASNIDCRLSRKRVSFANVDNYGEENGPSENAGPIIKKEISGEFHNEIQNETEDFTFESQVELDAAVPSPPPEDDVDWTQADDDDDDVDLKKGEENDDDSDYQPEPEPKKKDRRFTRKKPNVKENLRKKQIRERKAVSFDRVGCGMNVEPVKVDDISISYGCPQEGCEVKFVKKFNCHVHVLRDHYEDPMPYHCHVCDSKRFEAEKSLRKHMVRFHRGARCPYDEDYDPELHSAENLKSAVENDEVWKSFLNVTNEAGGRNSEHSSDDEGVPGIPSFPEEVLEKFKNNADTTFKCRHAPCKRKFFNEMLRDGHEKRIHQGIEKPFECEHCKKAFIRRTRLLEHMALAHYSNQLSCDHCGARFADKVLLAGHIGRAHLGDNTPFKCTSCPMTFARRTRMEVHMYKKHGTPLPTREPRRKIPARAIPVPKIAPAKAKKILEGEEPGFEPAPKKCWVCHEDGKPKLFDTTEDLKEHLEQTHTNTGLEKPFACPAPKCFKQYRTNGKLDCHIVNVHNGQIIEHTPGEFRCSECDETFHRSYLLEAHLAKRHGASMYMCNYCAKQFRTQRYLDDHQRQVHYKELNIDPHKCRYCDKVMNTKKSLAHHIKLVHTKDTPFKCTVAGCTFGTMYRSTMNVHMNVKHSDRQNAICPICCRTFAAQFYLNRHMRVHTGEKPYKCSTCDKLFSDLPTYNRHKEAHLGKIHKCPLPNCGKGYNTRHAWRVHLKQHQKKGDQVEVPCFRYLPTKMNVGEEEENEVITEGATPESEDRKLPVLEREGYSSSMDGIAASSNEDSLPPPLVLHDEQSTSTLYQSANDGMINFSNGQSAQSTVDLKPLF